MLNRLANLAQIKKIGRLSVADVIIMVINARTRSVVRYRLPIVPTGRDYGSTPSSPNRNVRRSIEWQLPRRSRSNVQPPTRYRWLVVISVKGRRKLPYCRGATR